MGSRRVTQETFDAAVRENVEEFELEPEEALAAAVQQFQSQGVDLSNIVKTAPKAAAGAPEPQHDVLQALDALRESVAGSRAPEAAAHLARFREQCARHRGGRFLAAERGAYPVVLAAGELGAAGGDHGLLLQALDALAALTDGQPGLLDAAGLWLLADALALHGDAAELTRAALRCVRHACLRHEGNRRALAGASVLPLLTGAVARHGRHAGVVTEACGALRALTCDDDARVPFGHGHDHARKIVQEHGGLRVLLDATRAFPDDPGVLGELCGTLSRLAVRNEFCRELVELGGLGVLLRLLAERADHQDLVRQVLSALRAVAGNDDVKDAIVRAGGAEAIVAAMVRHLASPQVCEQSCAALSILALRKPEHSRVIVESGGAQAALRAMRAHPREAAVQKQACMLIRNVVARSQALSQPLLELGAEALVAQARAAHPDCEDAAKAALRDLGCRVELREPWTGQKGDLAP
ncbi:armadillo repeat-containing protein 6 [Dasypus novemcinctus]|uniref:armadillo repeat-containing protein 6 n=1 Tax=Dasypus novemcinctus TaxID=9361 RepID=UPI00265F0A33|nr:armadillo repeat-containing protein 6 [Dasypus novemcinctus]XP_058148789.1 armadillo repeat-containing protein 6 [Dasypus novemcinctus]XP_058148790.1 armadillo repeat-containing protein 6 [Dasypus novemcinctus]XP_058148791.1 armadillo repeat-containing protein 6 [Dasypus novemcinctus]XP_058148792.1 armadillo repeat-containing protein 6 [Dasypus novemcinctus]XP_058148793.1 armadillo repeat-containing protein 6 [Dasypus novemcinctus]